MRVYIRKLTQNDTKKQIETTAEAYKYFFDGDSSNPDGKNFSVHTQNFHSDTFKVSKAAGNANSYRFASSYRGGLSFSTFINQNINGGYKADDILIMYNNNGEMSLDIITKESSSYSIFDSLIPKKQNTVMVLDDYELSYEKDIMEKDTNLSSSELVGKNKIYYGIPGCGKSYLIEQLMNFDALSPNKKEELSSEAQEICITSTVSDDNIVRTTFFLDYSNSDFVGQILPNVDEEGHVTYDKIPGPFTLALEKAYSKPGEMVYLIVEEINRGNAAGIFGDLFQLLDRKKKTDSKGYEGDSEYPITNVFIQSYMAEKGVTIPNNQNKIIIPHNLSILATMNTSDQNVFPLDTAFKRRWQMERVIGDMNQCEFAKYFIPYTNITWETFVDKVNKHIKECSVNGLVTEDKQLGPWFARREMFIDRGCEKDNKKALREFVYNVMDYIYNDVCKFEKDGWFKDGVSYDDICKTIMKYTINDEISTFVQNDLCILFIK